jgi:hypothetical protein
MKRRQASQREQAEAREQARAHRDDLLAKLQARESARREGDSPPTPSSPTPTEPSSDSSSAADGEETEPLAE